MHLPKITRIKAIQKVERKICFFIVSIFIIKGYLFLIMILSKLYKAQSKINFFIWHDLRLLINVDFFLMGCFYFISLIKLIKINNPKNRIKMPETKSIHFNICLLILVFNLSVNPLKNNHQMQEPINTPSINCITE